MSKRKRSDDDAPDGLVKAFRKLGTNCIGGYVSISRKRMLEDASQLNHVFKRMRILEHNPVTVPIASSPARTDARPPTPSASDENARLVKEIDTLRAMLAKVVKIAYRYKNRCEAMRLRREIVYSPNDPGRYISVK